MTNSKLIKILGILIISAFLTPFFISKSIALDLTNSPAIKVIGQPDYTTNMNNLRGLRLPYEVKDIGGKLFIVESANRISVHNTYPTSNFAPGDWAIGQTTINERFYPPTSAKYLGQVTSMDTDGTKMVVADATNNRVLIYNTIPTSGNAEANVVLGQPDFTSKTANNGGLSASSLSGPFAVRINNGKLYVADNTNNRILIWNTIPTSNNTPANVVLGQPNMGVGTANNGGVSAHSLKNPRGIMFNNNKMYVADYGNHRILIWNTIPTTDQADANVVLGQPNMSGNTANNGGISAHSLNYPTGLNIYNNKLYIADYNNNRVLIWNTLPTTDQADANLVLGQPDMTSNTVNNGGTSAHSLYNPWSTSVINGKLFISDFNNARILIFNTVPTTNQANADLVLGHASFTDGWVAGVNSPGADGGYNTIGNASRGSISNGKLLISDSARNRVLIWNNPESVSYPLNPDVIIGQPDIYSIAVNQGLANPTSRTLYYPNDAIICNNKLVVSDFINYRVLVWNTIPTSNNAPADVVIGQPDMSGKTSNNGGLSAHSLFMGMDLECINNKLLIADKGNSRVLIYNSVPTTDQADANMVLGQADFTHGSAYSGGISAHSLSLPSSIGSNGTKLFVGDGYARVLVWNEFPTQNNEDADVVLGQPDFTTATRNNGGISATAIDTPYAVYSDGTRLYEVDSANARVLVWNTIPTTNNAPADVVIGQDSFTSSVIGLSQNNLSMPYNISVYNDKLYVADDARILVFPFGPQGINADAPGMVSDGTISLQLDAEGAKEMIISQDSNFSGASWEPYSSTKDITLTSGDGRKVIYVKYKDYVDYEGEVLAISTILDTTAPTGSITILSPKSNGYTNSTTVTLKLSATDNVSGVRKMMISNNSSFAGASWENYSTSKIYQLSSGDGVKVVYVKYKDAAGNISTSYAASITLDTTAPVLTITKLGNEDYNSNTESYTETIGTPTMSGTGDAGSVVTIEEGTTVIGTTIVDESGNWSFTPTTALSNGSHNLTLKVEDSAGNRQVKGVMMIINVPEEHNTDNGNTGNNTGQDTDNNQNTDKNNESKKSWINASCLYGLLALLLVVIVLYFWNKSRKKDK